MLACSTGVPYRGWGRFYSPICVRAWGGGQPTQRSRISALGLAVSCILHGPIQLQGNEICGLEEGEREQEQQQP